MCYEAGNTLCFSSLPFYTLGELSHNNYNEGVKFSCRAHHVDLVTEFN